MKIRMVQLNPTVNDFEGNITKMLTFIDDSVDLIVFPEMSVTGYPPRDLLLRESFLDDTKQAIKRLKKETENIDVGILFGAHMKRDDMIFNCGILIENGRTVFVREKALLPQYDVFDDHHYFYGSRSTRICKFRGQRLGILVCEDAWAGKEKIYEESPFDNMVSLSPDILINIAASPFHRKKPGMRYKMFSQLIKKSDIPFIYVNAVGGNDDLVFDGNSMYLGRDGSLQEVCEPCIEHSIDINTEKHTPMRPIFSDGIDSVYLALILGIKDYYRKTGLKKAVLGISGGIDSALSLKLTVDALGAENVHGVAMPSVYSSEHSLADAQTLCQNLGVRMDKIGIADIVKKYKHTMPEVLKDGSLAEENIQARIRGNILMAISNSTGAMVITTGNKSEIAVGYCTIYGDMCGGLNPLGDLYKTDVYELARFINRNEQIIPESIIEKAPSAELQPDQKDQDTLPEYEVLDKILYMHIEKNLGEDEIIQRGFESSVVRWVIKTVALNEYKRKQSATIIKVSNRSFGQGWRMPIAKA
ncbi:MAG: NAD+ synthase [Candidatus Muiribacteriaceae bacterium]